MMSNRPQELFCNTVEDSLFTMTALNAFAGGPLAFGSILWGIFTCLITFSALLWTKDTITYNKRRIVMIALCTAMYAIATAHWGVVFSWWRKTSALEVANIAKRRPDLSQNITTNEVCSPVVSQSFTTPSHLMNNMAPACAPSVLLMVNIALSDAIVLFRAFVIWGRHRAIQVASIVLFIGLLATSGFNLYAACVSTPACVFCGSIGTPAVAVSCLLNSWATCMIGCKAWSHKRVIKNYLASGNRRTRSEKILALCVDSGIIYTSLWVVVVISDTATSPTLSSYLQSTGLVQLVGMYPTILVTAISWQKLLGTNEIQTVHVLTRDAQSSAQQPAHVRVEARDSSDVPTVSFDAIPSVIELGAVRNGNILRDSVDSGGLR